MKKRFLKVVLLTTLAFVLLLPVVAIGSTSRAAINTARGRLRTAGHNYNRQLARIQNLRRSQERAYARLIARQEAAEARLISRQQTALRNAYARFDGPNGLQARLDTAVTDWNTAVATTTTAAIWAARPARGQTGYGLGIAHIEDGRIAWDWPVGDLTPAQRAERGIITTRAAITLPAERLSIPYGSITILEVEGRRNPPENLRPANWRANADEWAELLPWRRALDGFTPNNFGTNGRVANLLNP